MSRRSYKIIPLGCQDCVHVWVGRCGLTGHVARFGTNAPYHCKEFKRDRRVGAADRVAGKPDSGRPILHLRDRTAD